MPENSHYRIDSPPVVVETIDEETIIVNLDTGSYYELNHVGGHVLHALNAGSDLDGAIAAVAGRYDMDPDSVTDAVTTLVDELVREGILQPSDEPPSDPRSSAHASAEGSQRAYEAPVLGKFTDMQELLLLDPVHEVDRMGWPPRV
jgi:hypothetical protein